MLWGMTSSHRIRDERHRENENGDDDEYPCQLHHAGNEYRAERWRERLVGDSDWRLDSAPSRCGPDRGAQAGESLGAQLR